MKKILLAALITFTTGTLSVYTKVKSVQPVSSIHFCYSDIRKELASGD